MDTKKQIANKNKSIKKQQKSISKQSSNMDSTTSSTISNVDNNNINKIKKKSKKQKPIVENNDEEDEEAPPSEISSKPTTTDLNTIPKPITKKKRKQPIASTISDDNNIKPLVITDTTMPDSELIERVARARDERQQGQNKMFDSDDDEDDDDQQPPTITIPNHIQLVTLRRSSTSTRPADVSLVKMLSGNQSIKRVAWSKLNAKKNNKRLLSPNNANNKRIKLKA
jgi:hypothetical protein